MLTAVLFGAEAAVLVVAEAVVLVVAEAVVPMLVLVRGGCPGSDGNGADDEASFQSYDDEDTATIFPSAPFFA